MSADELRTLILFEKLEDDQLEWLAAHGRIVEYPAGATIHVEGAPASCFLVLLSGMLAMSRRVQGGELELTRTDYRGSYTGAFNFYMTSHNVPDVYPATARAVKDCQLFELPAAELGKAFREWYPMAAHFLEGFSTQAMENRDAIERHERLVALGSVTAGLTHELHNPVAAVLRASARLREMLAEMREKLGLLIRSNLPADQARGGRRPGRSGTGELARGAEPVADRSIGSRGRGDRLVERSRDRRCVGDRTHVGRRWTRHRLARGTPRRDPATAPRLRAFLSGQGDRVGQPARRDHRQRRAHLGLARICPPVHPDGPGAAADGRRARSASTPP